MPSILFYLFPFRQGLFLHSNSLPITQQQLSLSRLHFYAPHSLLASKAPSFYISSGLITITYTNFKHALFYHQLSFFFFGLSP